MAGCERSKFFYFLGGAVLACGVIGLTIGFIVIEKSSDDDNHQMNKQAKKPVWGWQCKDERCQKFKLTSENNSTAWDLSTCRSVCDRSGMGSLWPLPTGPSEVSREFVEINIQDISFRQIDFKDDSDLWKAAEDRFKVMQQRKTSNFIPNSGGSKLVVEITVKSVEKSFDYSTNESYKLSISKDSNKNEVNVLISNINFYGARHALETLSQLIIFDTVRNEIMISKTVEIEDEPRFKHRGLSLDTSRNFFSVESIKRTIDGMAMVKLNSFHWHITDSQSFPLILKSHPELSEWGSYSADKVYTPADVIEIAEFAKARGIRVIPEIDIPGHVREGWFKKNLTSCYSSKPLDMCKGARPCGQLDPSKAEVYDVLKNIYGELFEYLNPSVMHLGGDEVFVECWNASASLRTWMEVKGWPLTNEGFMRLWGYFQDKAISSLDNAMRSTQKIPVIVWSSTLTLEPWLTQYLDKSRYIVQIWTKGDDEQVKVLLENGYKIIVSNYDALYFDCGFGSWVRDGNNWCSPYIGWQKVYDNRMETIAGPQIDQILGAEAALWTEQVDELSLDARIWPRASALAERLWTNPQYTTWRDAESRMLMHRTYLVNVGKLAAETLQPEWCLQNEGVCPL